MSCTHEMKQGAVVTVVSNPNGPAGCMFCENVTLRGLLEEAIDRICGDTADERDLMRRARAALKGGPDAGR